MLASRPAQSSLATKTATLVFLLLVVLGVGRTLQQQDLWFTDEARVAGMVVQMADRHLYSVPYLGSQPFVEKPPLYHISAALAYDLGGKPADPVVPLRLASIFWGLLTVAACFLLTETLLRREGLSERSPAMVRATAWAAAAVLLSTPGFIKNMVFVRVDIALAFCFMAALLCLCRWVFSQRPVYLYAGALFTSLAFLSKGIIGPALIAASVLALVPDVLALGRTHWREHGRHYMLAALVFVVPVATWLGMLYRHGGWDLFSFWLFDNQLGRFQGGSDLWHEEPGNYTYYFRSVYQYLAAWVVPFLGWMAWCAWTLLRRRPLPVSDRYLLLFFLLPMLLLSVASTKRPVYMVPLLPLCASAVAIFICRFESARLLLLARFIGLFCIALVVVLSGLSLVGPSIEALDPYLQQLSMPAGVLFIIAGGGLAFLLSQLRTSWLVVAPAQSLLLLFLACTYYPVVNIRHGQHPALQGFLRQVDDARLDETAGYRLSDALSGYLYAYTHRSFEPLTEDEVAAVLRGDDRRHRCVIFCGKPALELPPHEVLATMPENEQVEGLQMMCRSGT